MANVFVNGAGGFFGSHIVEHFVREGHAVTACARPTTDVAIAQAAGARIVRADVTDPQALRKVIAGHDVVVNVAGIFDMATPAETLYRVNHAGTRNVCEAVAQTGCGRFVQISTVAVYGPPVETPCREEAEKRPNNAYGKSKWAGEQVAFEYGRDRGFPVTAIRPTLVYGPRSQYGHAMYLAYFALQAARGVTKFPMVAPGPRTHQVHIRDVCRAAALVAFHPKAAGEAFNVVDDRPVTLKEFFEPIFDAVGIRIPFEIAYVPVLWRGILKTLLAVLPQKMPLLNRRLERDWKKLAADKGLVTPFAPRLDKDYMYFVYGDVVFAGEKIKALGFVPEYPDYRAGMTESIDWYRRERWIP
jgi:nucleoside-diphosphate-sugar epimerase